MIPASLSHIDYDLTKQAMFEAEVELYPGTTEFRHRLRVLSDQLLDAGYDMMWVAGVTTFSPWQKHVMDAFSLEGSPVILDDPILKQKCQLSMQVVRETLNEYADWPYCHQHVVPMQMMLDCKLEILCVSASQGTIHYWRLS
jgi:hypothetical protein